VRKGGEEAEEEDVQRIYGVSCLAQSVDPDELPGDEGREGKDVIPHLKKDFLSSSPSCFSRQMP